MDKRAYLSRLSDNLERYVPDQERWDILRWYEEYFKDAGEGNEQAVIQELGDPATLARRLAEERGYGEKRKGPRMWQILLGAVIVVIIAIPLMAFSPLAQLLGFHRVTHDPVEFVTTVPVEQEPSVWYEPAPGYGIDVSINAEGVNVDLHPEDIDSPSVRTNGMGADGDNLYWDFDGQSLYVEWYGSGESGQKAAGTLTVAIPASWELVQVCVYLDGAGDAAVSDLQPCNELYVETEVGNVTAKRIVGVSDYLSLHANVGEVAFDGLPASDGSTYLSAEKGNISATLYCMDRSVPYDLHTDVGTVTVDGMDCGTSASYSSGGFNYDFNAWTSVGDVSLAFDPEGVVGVIQGEDGSGIYTIVPTSPPVSVGTAAFDLTQGSLIAPAEELGDKVFYTNSERIRVTVEKTGDFQGSVMLWNTEDPDSFIRVHAVDRGNAEVTFTGLSAAHRYRITTSGLEGALVTVSG